MLAAELGGQSVVLLLGERCVEELHTFTLQPSEQVLWAQHSGSRSCVLGEGSQAMDWVGTRCVVADVGDEEDAEHDE